MTRLNGRKRSRHGASPGLAGRHNPVTFEGVDYQDVAAAARAYDQKPKTVTARMVRGGMTLSEALTTPTKHKAGAVEMADRRADVLALIKSMEASGNTPMSVQQFYYQATVHKIVPKTTSGRKWISEEVTALREAGVVEWELFTDHTRRVIMFDTVSSVADALNQCAETAYRDPWCDADVTVSIWMEKEALGGVVRPVTLELGVPLYPIRGFGGSGYIKAQCDKFIAANRPLYAYHLGDFDPSGRKAAATLERKLKQFCKGKVSVIFKSLALDSIAQCKDLPSRETKVSDTQLEWFVREYGADKRVKTLYRDLAALKAKGFAAGLSPQQITADKQAYLLELSPDSVELDAMEPDKMRKLVRNAIMKHTDADRIARNEIIENEIRDKLTAIAKREAGRS